MTNLLGLFFGLLRGSGDVSSQHFSTLWRNGEMMWNLALIDERDYHSGATGARRHHRSDDFVRPHQGSARCFFCFASRNFRELTDVL